MSPGEAATMLEGWAAKAKTNEQREACEMAAMAMKNSAMARQIVAKTGDLTINVVKDGDVEFFAVWAPKTVTIGAPTLGDALKGLLDKLGGTA